ncbi:hypothetical protein JCM1841_002082 [Sporobolomyces salmonicolor]
MRSRKRTRTTSSPSVSSSPSTPASLSPAPPSSNSRPKPSHALRMSYTIGRGEQGVLTFEPYKSYLLPLWRFRTPAIARESSEALWREFEAFGAEGDWVGQDMCRKFVQMGMTRAKRYANHSGGRKYDARSGELLPRSSTHKGAQEKLEASEVFREVWERCKADETYKERRREWEGMKKAWMREHGNEKQEEEKGGEDGKKGETKASGRGRKRRTEAGESEEA